MRPKPRGIVFDEYGELVHGITAEEVHGYKLQQPIGFLAKHVEKPDKPVKRKSQTRKVNNQRKSK